MLSKDKKKTNLGGILAIDLEPTPYKTDMWNAVAVVRKSKLLVIYTEDKNPAADGGHNYQQWPIRRYDYLTLSGMKLSGQFKSAKVVIGNIFFDKPELVFIAGYDRPVCLLAILVCCLLCRRFVVHADVYNLAMPAGRFSALRLVVRESIRKLVFWKSASVLVCGIEGLESAEPAGCASTKIIDFPYVIDVHRMLSESPDILPLSCDADLESGALIIMFSGRMISRKGLETLISALPRLKNSNTDWVLWIEGDGLELDKYKMLASELGVLDKCRFLGFCQYDVHGWLMRRAFSWVS